MKVKGQKKGGKNSKLTITFDQEKRKDYVTGFRKRKKERQEKADAYNQAKAKKEKLAARQMRRKQAQAIIEEFEESNLKAKKAWDDSSDSDSDDGTTAGNTIPYTGSTDAAVTDTVTTKCGSATVEIATLGLTSKHFIGSNTDFKSIKLDSSSILRGGHKLKLGGAQKVKVETQEQSFSELVKDAMKRVKKKAKQTGTDLGFIKKSKLKKKSKSNPLVTEL